MNASLVCLVAVLSAAEPQPSWQPVFSPSTQLVAAAQGQVPQYEEQQPNVGQPEFSESQPDFVAPQQPAPLQAPPGNSYDPFLSQPGQQFGQVAPMYSTVPSPSGVPWSGFGPPQRGPGWTTNYDLAFLPKERTSRGNGQFASTEFDFNWVYANLDQYGNVAAIAPELGTRLWDGPRTATGSTTSLPGSVYHLGLDFQWNTDRNSPFSLELGFNPSINSDFDDSLSSDAWNFDGRGVLYYRPSQYLAYALGVAYWDRVDDRFVPYVGFIYNEERWEWRVMFPETRVSYQLGEFWMASQWLYARIQYDVEAYQIRLQTTGSREKVQLSDWRAVIGLWSDHRMFTKFIEAGWVFGRDVDYLHGTPGFDISTGFVARHGITY